VNDVKRLPNEPLLLWLENIEPPLLGWRVERANATGLQLLVLIPGLWCCRVVGRSSTAGRSPWVRQISCGRWCSAV